MINRTKISKTKYRALALLGATILAVSSLAPASAIEAAANYEESETSILITEVIEEADSDADADVDTNTEEGSETNADDSVSDAVTEDNADTATGTGTITLATADNITSVSFSETGSNVSVSTDSDTGVTALTISESGDYTLTGNAVNTYVSIAKGLTVSLTLSDLTIDDTALCVKSGKDYPVIQVGKNSTVALSLTGESTLTGSSTFAEEAVPIIKAPSSVLTIEGSGILNICNSLDDAIKAKNGTVNITSGTLNITDEIYGDGIQAEFVNISGGAVNITTIFNNAATGYYTSGSSSTTLNTITETNDKYKTERINVNTGDHSGIKAGTKEATKIYTDLKASGSEDATETSSASGGIIISGGTVTINTLGAGLKANKVTTSGYTACSNGQYVIGSPDDALHSNNDITISGGTVIIYSSDDGITAAGKLYITGSGTVVDIESAFEGMEGSEIVFGTEGSSDGPTVTINTDDDGINAAHKGNVTYTYDSSENDDCYYTKTTEKMSGNSCTVYSGTVTVMIDSTSAKTRTLRNGSAASETTLTYYADGDGIDCNGTLDLEGGETYVFGASTGTANSPLDTDAGFTLSENATLLATGSDSMNESKPGYGSGTYIYYGGNSMGQAPGMNGNSGMPSAPGSSDNSGMPSVSGSNDNSRMPGAPGAGGQMGPGGESAASISAGSVFRVTSGSTTLIEKTLPYAASFIIYSSHALTSDSTYTATINGSEITMTKATASGTNTNPGSGQSGTNPPDQPGQPGQPGQPTQPGEPGSDPTAQIDDSVNTVTSGQDTNINYSKSVSEEKNVISYNAEMVKGQKYTFGAGTWTSSDKTVAAVNAKTGLVSAKKNGTATITDTSGEYTVKYNVTVHTPVLSAKKASLKVGDTTEISISDTGDMPVTWTSSNNGVFNVTPDSAGKSATLTATGKGTAKLTAYVGGQKYIAAVTVTAATNGLIKSDIYMNVGQTVALKHTGVTNKNIQDWSTDDTTGCITLVNADKATVKIKTSAASDVTFPLDVHLTCKTATDTLVTTLHIEDPSLTCDTDQSSTAEYGRLARTKATAYNYTLNLKTGDTYKISLPGSDRQIIWNSSAKAKVFADETGLITARAAGTSTVTAKINNKTIKIIVKVSD